MDFEHCYATNLKATPRLGDVATILATPIIRDINAAGEVVCCGKNLYLTVYVLRL